MNIFFLSNDPVLAAEYNCDKHLVSQFKEICQMLAFCFADDFIQDAPKTQAGKVRVNKGTHYNHPTSKWIRESLPNYGWAIQHAYALDEERLWRSDGNKEKHFSRKFLDWCDRNYKYTSFDKVELTDFAVAINAENKCCQLPEYPYLTPVEKYRQYYILDKPFVTWKKRGPPYWFNQ